MLNGLIRMFGAIFDDLAYLHTAGSRKHDGGCGMSEYHKIQTVFSRDPETKYKTLLEGQYSLPEFEYLKNNEWVFTEKVDGTNIRVFWNGTLDNLSYGGRTDNADIPAHLYQGLEILFGKNEKLKEVFPDGPATLYGEGYGAKIQKGGAYLDHASFILFDVKVGPYWLKREAVDEIASKLGIKSVPIIGRGTLQDAIELCREGLESRLMDRFAEGLVMRPKVELVDRMGRRIISKIKGVYPLDISIAPSHGGTL